MIFFALTDHDTTILVAGIAAFASVLSSAIGAYAVIKVRQVHTLANGTIERLESHLEVRTDERDLLQRAVDLQVAPDQVPNDPGA